MRAAIRTPRLRTVFDRVDCAKTAVDWAKLHEGDACDRTCQRELVGLYKDAAAYARRAHDAANGAALIEKYGAFEIQVRSTLHDLLEAQGDALDPGGQELRRNFADLADAYQMQQNAYGYHQLISGDHVRATLGPKAIYVWALAVRSCSRWDFNASNRDRVRIRSELCGAECRPELTKLVTTLAQTTPEARERVGDLVPQLSDCPAEP